MRRLVHLFALTATAVGVSVFAVASAPAPASAVVATKWLQVSPGMSHTCALDTNQVVYCWGDNTFGQLGIGNTAPASYPVPVISGVKKVAAGATHTCAARTDNTLWCWGTNSTGELGIGTASAGLVTRPTRSLINNTAELALGFNFSCASKTDGTLWCWGSNTTGQLGIGFNSLGGVQPTPTQLFFAGTARVTAGEQHACASKTDGTLWCWGYGGAGQLGLGNQQNQGAPRQLLFNNTRSVSAGKSHTCATRTDGALWCWGSNSDGQLGIGAKFYPFLAPQQLMFAGASSATTGVAHSCASKTDGTLWCWGSNSNGQLGIGLAGSKVAPTQLMFASTAAINAGSNANHSCAIRSDATLWCWGSNSKGQLGIGNTASQGKPTQV